MSDVEGLSHEEMHQIRSAMYVPTMALMTIVERIIAVRVQATRAEDWDDGYDAGHEDARAVQATYPDPTPNPHRSQAGGCAGAPSTTAESGETGPPSRLGSVPEPGAER